MGVHPEQMLVKQRVSAFVRVKETDIEKSFQHDKDQRDGDNRGRQDLDPGGGIQGPGKKRYLQPAHTLDPHAMNRGDKIETGQHRGHSKNKRRCNGHGNIAFRADTERHIKGPAGVGKALSRRKVK